MRRLFFVILIAVVSLMNVFAQTPEKLAAAWDDDHVSTAFPSDTRHADLKKYLDQLKKLGLKVAQVGLSNANREIYQVE